MISNKKAYPVLFIVALVLAVLSIDSYGLASSAAPAKQQIPFADSAGGAYKRTVPVASQIGIQDGAASYTDGFPPLNFTPVSAGGVPPFGQDMNGIFNATTALTRWYSAGGPILYDGTYQTAIGGYPLGAIVQSATTVGRLWVSTTENNVTNPDTGGAGWTYPANAINCTNLSGGTVNAAASSGYAVIGAGSAGPAGGVHGSTANSGSFGVLGEGVLSGTGVKGTSGTNGTGVHGEIATGVGVKGVATSSGSGVQGISVSGIGVTGTSTSSYGVIAQSGSGSGIRATSSTGPALTIVPLSQPTTGVEAGSIYLTVNSGVSVVLHIYDGSTWRSTTLTTTP